MTRSQTFRASGWAITSVLASGAMAAETSEVENCPKNLPARVNLTEPTVTRARIYWETRRGVPVA